MKRFHHLGFVSSSLERAKSLLPPGSQEVLEVVEDAEQHNTIVIFNGSGTVDWFEVIIPLSPASTVANHLAKNGPGLHHIAFEVPSIFLALKSYLGTPGAVLLGGYTLKVETFGGEIETKFVMSNGMLIEVLERAHA